MMEIASNTTTITGSNTSTGGDVPRAPPLTGGERKRSEVEAAARAAGLVSDSAGAQVLRFAGQLNSNELRLMEMPREVLEALRSGERCVCMCVCVCVCMCVCVCVCMCKPGL